MVSGRFRLAAAALALLPWPGAAAQEPVADPPFVVRSEFSELSPWERSQVVYTVRVYRPAGARRTDRIRSLDEPVLLSGEALVQRLGNDREYTARPADAETLVLERRYAIFPQSPGELRLMPVSLQWIGGEFGFRTRRFAAAAEPESLQVRSVPSPPAGKWLAAAAVRIWDEFERPPEALRVGEPLVRLLGVRVEGQPARQIPELIPGDGPNFRHFIERAEFEDQVTVGGLVGVRRQRAALLASRAGDVVLPAIRIDWWDTSRQRWSTAELPQRILEARGPPASAVAGPVASGPESVAANDWLVAAFAAGWLVDGSGLVGFAAVRRGSAPKARMARAPGKPCRRRQARARKGACGSGRRLPPQRGAGGRAGCPRLVAEPLERPATAQPGRYRPALRRTAGGSLPPAFRRALRRAARQLGPRRPARSGALGPAARAAAQGARPPVAAPVARKGRGERVAAGPRAGRSDCRVLPADAPFSLRSRVGPLPAAGLIDLTGSRIRKARHDHRQPHSSARASSGRRS